MTEVTEARLEDIEALFVQTGERLTSDGNGQITLEGDIAVDALLRRSAPARGRPHGHRPFHRPLGRGRQQLRD